MIAALPAPSADLAQRILATCSYAERLPAGRFTARVGIMRGTVRGLPELHLYLAPDERSLPAVNFEKLADWIETVVADAALADATRAATRGADSYVNGCIAMHGVVGRRLAQARAVLGLPAAGAPDNGSGAS
ncbi:MAG: hypothetical protein U1F54_07705 [Burkholderiales bacterium]